MAKRKGEIRPVVESPIKVNLVKKGNYSAISKKVLPHCIIDENDLARMLGVEPGLLADMLKRIEECIRNGNDVVLFNSLRFYGCLDKDGQKLLIVCQTMGRFRNSASDAKVVMIRRDNNAREKMIRNEDGERMIQAACARRREMICVSPDLIVRCPNCSTEFRIGKVLGNKR